MYALSTMAMNHRRFFKEYYGDDETPFHLESETTYNRIFPDNAKPHTMARQILLDLDMDGTHYVRRPQWPHPHHLARSPPVDQTHHLHPRRRPITHRTPGIPHPNHVGIIAPPQRL